jgi:hypothetical protein
MVLKMTNDKFAVVEDLIFQTHRLLLFLMKRRQTRRKSFEVNIYILSDPFKKTSSQFIIQLLRRNTSEGHQTKASFHSGRNTKSLIFSFQMTTTFM